MKLVFATNNQNKLKEIQAILGEKFELLSLKDIHCNEEIPEDYNTLEDNASQKAFYIFNKYQLDCFADDTGLEIVALNNKPGVYSARYAGEDKNPEKNVKKVLSEMQKIQNRKARFRTVISLVLQGREYQFEGIVNGQILKAKRGSDGFGYDPIFQPEGYKLSFAEMNMAKKNTISHRGKAIEKLVKFLLSLKN